MDNELMDSNNYVIQIYPTVDENYLWKIFLTLKQDLYLKVAKVFKPTNVRKLLVFLDISIIYIIYYSLLKENR